MKNLKTLLVLTGLSVSLLAGCNVNTSKPASVEPATSEPTSAPTSSLEPTTSVEPSTTSTSEPVVEALASITVVSEPTKKSYRVGEQLNTEGLAVKAVYNTGREENLAADAYQLSGFDSTAAGLKTITVTYQGKTTTFAVSVFGKDGLEITAAPDKVVYAVGDEFDATGLQVSQKWGDGTADALAETEYVVSGFDSATAGEKTITVTAGDQTATFTVNVYAKAWSSADKTLANEYLLFEIPYFLGFSLAEGGLHYIDSGEEAVKWIEARTDYSTTEADLDAYKAQIEAIKVSGKQAWSEFETTGESKYTNDLDLLGFDDESEVYQYARWYNDSADANGYQVISIGLDPDGKLLAVATVCVLPLAGYGIDGGGWYAAGVDEDTGESFDMVKEICSIADVRSQMIDDDAYDLDLGWSDFLVWPEYNDQSVIMFASLEYDSPYVGTSIYSNEFDPGSCEFIITNNYGTNPAYTEDTLAEMLAAYEAKGVTFVADTESNPHITFYDADVTVNGYDLSLEYYYSSASAIILVVKVNGFNLPFHADIYRDSLANVFAAYAKSASKTFTHIEQLDSYSEEQNLASSSYLIGYADNATTGFVNGITLTEKNFVIGGLRQSGLLTAAEINGLTWTTRGSYSAGTAKVGEEANVQYEIVETETDKYIAFVSGGFSYEARYDENAKTLTVIKDSVADEAFEAETIVLTEENFTAASGSNNDPFAGTWDNGEFKLNLGKSKVITTSVDVMFVVSREDGSAIVYDIVLNVVDMGNGRLGILCSIVTMCLDSVPVTAK